MYKAEYKLVVVYLGVIFKEAGERQEGTPKDRRSTIISAVVLVVGFGMSPSESRQALIGSCHYLRGLVHLQADEQGSNRRLAKEAVSLSSVCEGGTDVRMEAKAKGLSEDTVMAEIGGHKEFQEQELEDARSPILRDPAPYQNPYDIGYVFISSV
jgi:hypothetical protein